MNSGKGQLSIDGNEPISVDYDLDETGRGYIAADRKQMVQAHLGHAVELVDQNRKTLQVIVDSVGPIGGGDFHVVGSDE